MNTTIEESLAWKYSDGKTDATDYVQMLIYAGMQLPNTGKGAYFVTRPISTKKEQA